MWWGLNSGSSGPSVLGGGPSALPGEKEIQEGDEKNPPASRRFVSWIAFVPSSRFSSVRTFRWYG
jgi:hypothetical protein